MQTACATVNSTAKCYLILKKKIAQTVSPVKKEPLHAWTIGEYEKYPSSTHTVKTVTLMAIDTCNC